jgi:hypothetical protein
VEEYSPQRARSSQSFSTLLLGALCASAVRLFLKDQPLHETLTTQKQLVLTAPASLGKSTQVPQMLFGLPPENVQLLIAAEKYCERNNRKCKTELLEIPLS